MKLEIIQPEEDKTNYLKKVCSFIDANGVRTKDALESRFDALLTQFAMQHNGVYDAEKGILTIKPNET